MIAKVDDAVVDLPDPTAEIDYLTNLTCERCNAPVRVQRQGVRPIDSGPDLFLMGFWQARCTRCHCCKQIVTCVRIP